MLADVADAAVAAAPPAAKTFDQMIAEKQPYYQKRISRFEGFHAREVARVEAAKQANEPISVVLPDGKVKAAVKGVTTPMDIAKEISAGLAKKVVVADVDGAPWDLMRPLEGDCAIKLFSFEDAEGRDVRFARAAGLACVAGYACNLLSLAVPSCASCTTCLSVPRITHAAPGRRQAGSARTACGVPARGWPFELGRGPHAGSSGAAWGVTCLHKHARACSS